MSWPDAQPFKIRSMGRAGDDARFWRDAEDGRNGIGSERRGRGDCRRCRNEHCCREIDIGLILEATYSEMVAGLTDRRSDQDR